MPPSPLIRSGPRPVMLHLAMALASTTSLPAAWMLSKHGLLTLNAEAQKIQSRFGNLTCAELGPLLGQAASAQLDKLAAGISRYQNHPHRRTLADPPVIWREGSARLLDYGVPSPAQRERVRVRVRVRVRNQGPVQPVALFIPSLINRATILDLDEKRSLMRHLAGKGIRPLLLDWGTPGRIESGFDLAAVVGRVVRALRHLDAPVHLVGYCMGGLIALAAAARVEVKSLALLATPWDFHAAERKRAQYISDFWALWQPLAEKIGTLPTDAVQSLFVLADPFGPQAKFRAFADLKPDSAEAHDFVVLEDWINDGMPLPHKVAGECLSGFYGNNLTAKNKWLVKPAEVTVPTLVIVPTADRIVPPASARALAEKLPHATRLDVPFGHVGMIVSRDAPKSVWQPLAEWLHRA